MPRANFERPHRLPPAQAVPHTSCANSTTSRSLASCISGLIGLPNSVLAKPHCGLMARRSSGTNRLASSMRCLSAALSSRKFSLGRDEAEHDGLVLRHEPQRREIARARRVVFEEEEADIERVEQLLGDRLVASFRMPLPAAVAAAQMHADVQAGQVADRAVGHRDVSCRSARPDRRRARAAPRAHPDRRTWRTRSRRSARKCSRPPRANAARCWNAATMSSQNCSTSR